jgi:hypothetical protein
LENKLSISVEFIHGLWTGDPSLRLQETRWIEKGIKGGIIEMGRGLERVA